MTGETRTPDATIEEVDGVARRRRRRLRTRHEADYRPRAAMFVMGFLIALTVLALVFALYGDPPRDCTWRYEHYGKGAYSGECVPNRPTRH